MRVASLHLMVKIKSIANYVKMFHTYNDSIILGIVVILNIKTSVSLNVNDVAIIVILATMRLADTTTTMSLWQFKEVITPSFFPLKDILSINSNYINSGLSILCKE